MIQKKTWPYGTTRRGVVCIADWRPKGLPASVQAGQLIKDELNEMHICCGDHCADLTANAGDAGTLTFTKGGPTGGYWKFTKDKNGKKQNYYKCVGCGECVDADQTHGKCENCGGTKWLPMTDTNTDE